MQKLFCYLFCLIVIVFFASCGVFNHKSSRLIFAPNPVVAHRGAFKKNNFPENSIAALKEAIRLKCTGSEFDVRMTADDSLVVNHDPHYNGLEIEKVSYEQLVAKPLANGEVMPTLRQYLNAGALNNDHTRLVLEIKPSGLGTEKGKEIATKVVSLVKEMNLKKYIEYISFDLAILKKIIEIDSAAQTNYLNGDISPDKLKAEGITGADYHISVFKLRPEWIEMAHQNGIILNAWTVNDEKDMRWLLSKKFHFVTTNEPELLLSIWDLHQHK